MTITALPENSQQTESSPLPDDSMEPIDGVDEPIPAQNLLGITDSAGDADGALTGVRFAFVAPRYLVPNDINRTFTEAELSDLLTSVPVVGFLQPAVVVPTDPPAPGDTSPGDGSAGDAAYYRVLIGNRRRAAAEHLGRSLPCLIASSEDSVQEILAILSENDDRLALKPSQRADLYRQLTLMDWTPAKIARARGVKATEVNQALSLLELPGAVRAAADAGQLPLELAPALASLEDDPQALAKVLEKGGRWGFRHAVNDAIERRDRAQAAEQLATELAAAGVEVVAKPAGFDDRSIKATAVRDLIDSDGEPVDEVAVRALPGFAAFIEKTSTPRAVVFCRDPEKHGYTRTGFTRYVSDEEKAQRRAELAAAEEYRAALRAAAIVRREFLVSHYGNARRAKATQPEVLRAVIANPKTLEYPVEYQELADAVAGVRIDEVVATAGTDRLARMLVARWVTSSERNLIAVAGPQVWGTDEPGAVAYLERLVGAGYELSDAEQQLLTALTDRLNPAEDDNGEDDEDDEGGESGDDIDEDGVDEGATEDAMKEDSDENAADERPTDAAHGPEGDADRADDVQTEPEETDEAGVADRSGQDPAGEPVPAPAGDPGDDARGEDYAA